jgi:hypothetical protein
MRKNHLRELRVRAVNTPYLQIFPDFCKQEAREEQRLE